MKFAIEAARDLKDLIRRLSVGLGKLDRDVKELQTFVGFRADYDYATYGADETFTAQTEATRQNFSYVFATKVYDSKETYAIDKGIYKIPSDGYYQMYMQIDAFYFSEEDDVIISLDKNGEVISRFCQTQAGDSSSNYVKILGQTTLYFNKDDKLDLKVYCWVDTSFRLSFGPHGASGVTKAKGAFWEVRKVGT